MHTLSSSNSPVCRKGIDLCLWQFKINKHKRLQFPSQQTRQHTIPNHTQTLQEFFFFFIYQMYDATRDGYDNDFGWVQHMYRDVWWVMWQWHVMRCTCTEMRWGTSITCTYIHTYNTKKVKIMMPAFEKSVYCTYVRTYQWHRGVALIRGMEGKLIIINASRCRKNMHITRERRARRRCV